MRCGDRSPARRNPVFEDRRAGRVPTWRQLPGPWSITSPTYWRGNRERVTMTAGEQKTMADELKSAWELALEKLEADPDTAARKLSDEQKAEISELRRQMQAKIAEAEIALQSSIKTAVQRGDYSEIETLRERLAEEKKRISAEWEGKIEKVRNRID